MKPCISSTVRLNASCADSPGSDSSTSALDSLDMVDDESMPALSRSPAMLADCSKLKPSACSVGPLLCMMLVSWSKPMPVFCATPNM